MFKKVPHTYVIVFSLIVMAAVATWFVPGGQYVAPEDGSTTLVNSKNSLLRTIIFIFAGKNGSRN